MSKQYGLIVPNKNKTKQPMIRPSIFGEDSDSEPEIQRPITQQKLKKQHKITQEKAIEEDPTVFQYDEVYDEMDRQRKESKLSRKDLDKKPKYINRLLAAAERRKRENERRIERQVQREREAEGDEFKDKESYITSAYRKKLEEMKEMEELEKREEYLETIGDVRKQGNLDGFYRHLYDQKVNFEDKPEEGTTSEVKQEPTSDDDDEEQQNKSGSDNKEETEEPKRKKRKYRRRNDSEQSESGETLQEEEIKKEHLPSNLDADSDFSIDSSDSEDEKTDPKSAPVITDDVKPEPVEKKEAKKPEIEQVEETKKEPEIQKEQKPKIDIWKKRTVGEVFDAALQRYYERKAVREL